MFSKLMMQKFLSLKNTFILKFFKTRLVGLFLQA